MRNALRSFRLDRIVELTLLDKTFQTPADFDIRAFLAQPLESETKVQMRMRFAPQGAHIARDLSGIWDALEEQSDSAVIVTLTMPDLQWAASMALGFGPIVTVLAPEELRQTVRACAIAVAEQYASAQSEGFVR